MVKFQFFVFLQNVNSMTLLSLPVTISWLVVALLANSFNQRQVYVLTFTSETRFGWITELSFINLNDVTFAKCSIVTITLDSLETRSIAPPMPFTIFPCQSINQSIKQTINRSLNQSINQFTNQSTILPIDQSINQLVHQSINQSNSQSVSDAIQSNACRSIDR